MDERARERLSSEQGIRPLPSPDTAAPSAYCTAVGRGTAAASAVEAAAAAADGQSRQPSSGEKKRKQKQEKKQQIRPVGLGLFRDGMDLAAVQGHVPGRLDADAGHTTWSEIDSTLVYPIIDRNERVFFLLEAPREKRDGCSGFSGVLSAGLLRGSEAPSSD